MTDTALKNPIVTAVMAVKNGEDVAAVSSSNPLPTALDARTNFGQAALEGRAFFAKLTAAAVAAKYTAIQVYNPVGSGVVVEINGMNGWNSAGSMIWQRLKSSSALLSSGGHKINLNFNSGNAAKVELRYDNLAALTTVTTSNDFSTIPVATQVSTGTGSLLSSIVLYEGQGFQFEGQTANVGMSAFWTITEIPKANF